MPSCASMDYSLELFSNKYIRTQIYYKYLGDI